MESILIDGYLANSILISRSFPNSVSISKYLPDMYLWMGMFPFLYLLIALCLMLIERTYLKCLHFCIIPEVQEQKWEAIQGIVLKNKRSKGNQRVQI